MNSNKAHAERTMTESWVTPGGSNIALTVTVYAWDCDWSQKTTVDCNGKIDEYARFDTINGQNVVKFDGASKAAVVSDEIVAKNDAMIEWAKAEIKERQEAYEQQLVTERRSAHS